MNLQVNLFHISVTYDVAACHQKSNNEYDGHHNGSWRKFSNGIKYKLSVDSIGHIISKINVDLYDAENKC